MEYNAVYTQVCLPKQPDTHNTQTQTHKHTNTQAHTLTHLERGGRVCQATPPVFYQLQCPLTA